MAYYTIPILPHHGGCGMWQAGEANGEGWYDDHDLLGAMHSGIDSELYELGVETLPDDIEDIRGKVYNEPDRIFAYYTEDALGRYPAYMGITQRAEPTHTKEHDDV